MTPGPLCGPGGRGFEFRRSPLKKSLHRSGFCVSATSTSLVVQLRRRIEVEGAADGDVRDFESPWIMGCFDPDGAAHEVMLERPGRRDADMLEPADWTTVTLG